MSKLKELFLNKIFGIISVSAVVLYFISFKIFNNNTLSLIASGGCNTNYTTGNIIVDTINVYLGRFVLSAAIAGLMFIAYEFGIPLLKKWLLVLKDRFTIKKTQNEKIYWSQELIDIVPENHSLGKSIKFYLMNVSYIILDLIREKFLGLTFVISFFIIFISYGNFIPGSTKECNVSLMSAITTFASGIFILVSIGLAMVVSYPFLNEQFAKILPSTKKYLSEYDYNISWRKVKRLADLWFGDTYQSIRKHIKSLPYEVDDISCYHDTFNIDIRRVINTNMFIADIKFYDIIDCTAIRINIRYLKANGMGVYSSDLYFHKHITAKQVLEYVYPIVTKEIDNYIERVVKPEELAEKLHQEALNKVDEKMAELEIAIDENLINPT